MMSKYNIPDSINKHIDGEAYTTNEIGMSGSSVRVFDDYVLKIVSRDTEDEDEVVRISCLRRWESHLTAKRSAGIPSLMNCTKF